jgi:methylglyoxal synthase
MQTTLALIAHDHRKKEMVSFCMKYHQHLMRLSLIATGSTGARLAEATGLPVECVLPGAAGGDLQIAARVATGEVQGVIFLMDAWKQAAHDPDVQPLIRVCTTQNIPLALNLATAEMLIRHLS